MKLLRSLAVLMLALLMVTVGTAQDNPDGFPEPSKVVIAGSFQDEVGCSGEWQPPCDTTALTFNAETGLWEGAFEIPAGDYAFKVALDGAWDRNYGAGAVASGPDIPLSVAETTTVTFTYDHRTGVISDSINGEQPNERPSTSASAPGGPVVIPSMVGIPGTLQPAIGCPGEWQPECPQSALTLNAAAGIFEATFDIPAGSYEYKVAIDGSWTENYGGFADKDGPNIVLGLAEDTAVTFIYSPATHWVMDNVRHQIVTAPGSYQDDIGCPGEWQPECMLSWLQDPDGDGIYNFTTTAIPAGDYEAKATINRSWDENYGANGEAGGANIAFNVPEDGEPVTFTYDSAQHIMVVSVGGGSVSAANLRERRAHWVSADTLAWNITPDEDVTYKLLTSADAGLKLDLFGLSGEFTAYDLAVNSSGLSADVLAKFPHLSGYAALTLPAEAVDAARDILRGQFAVAAYNGDKLLDITGLQIPGVVDELYTTDAPLGVTFADGVPTISVWAPTAQDVSFNLYADASAGTDPVNMPMTRSDDGVWSITGDASWVNQYYTFTVRVYAPSEMAIVDNIVTDPYSVSLSQNSRHSQIVDLSDPTLKPDGWDALVKPDYGTAFEDITVYELHIRDFSVFDETVPEELRGTYGAFTVADSDGMNHLRALADAGLTHLQLLPSFDLATINENRARHFEPDYAAFVGLPPDSDVPQAEIDKIRDLDGFNWGYDPYHFMTPEGSYATTANGTARILEYREMVQAINTAGLRVVQDVVFNHTNSSGQGARSVLDKVVPGYYHRLDASGNVTRSTCCENTATEHNMMRRLMVDTVVLEAVQYKIDGFRFDLMGHHMLADMLAVREALDALTIENSGVDGSQIYLYGEGWNFGEVMDDARGVNATQINAAGSGIGTFNDRLRDSVRGGSPFGDRDLQGLGNGLYTDPNGLNPLNADLSRVLLLSDRVRIGLAGNLRDYTFLSGTGEMVTGWDIDYNGQHAGYTLDPQENIVYVDKHDNETLFDNMLYRLPPGTTSDELVRMQTLSSSFVLYAQGVPFVQAGSDIMRSKSMDRNSYNSGDWFNRLDWTMQTNNFGVGLPPSADNSAQYDLIRPILNTPEYVVSPEQIALSHALFLDMLRVRYSSPLFRLQTAEDIMARVAMLNTGPEQIPGVIVMELSDLPEPDLDPNAESIVVIFNTSDEPLTYSSMSFIGRGHVLHPVLAASVDSVTASSAFDSATGTFTIPPLTAAVFVEAE